MGDLVHIDDIDLGDFDLADGDLDIGRSREKRNKYYRDCQRRRYVPHPREPRVRDKLIGQVFGTLRVIRFCVGTRRTWECVCTCCGRTRFVDAENLRTGRTKGCGGGRQPNRARPGNHTRLAPHLAMWQASPEGRRVMADRMRATNAKRWAAFHAQKAQDRI
jgi:hypothetical protein